MSEIENRDQFISALLTLLDLIELKQDWRLSKQRFDIMDKYGTWKIEGLASGEVH